ncbi:hypothetical protein BDD12DRAFT_880890 [Trichophaea hybrida]|nr:hypothetical protein BDD12DRAFT_880890 [Trichophaea hybrida]
MSAPTPLLKRRGVVISISAVVIIAVGAFTGAMLKTDQEKIAEVQKVQSEGLDDRIDRLKGYRLGLELQKKGLEGKLAALREKGGSGDSQ